MSNVSYINVNGHLYPFDDPQLTEEVENIRIGADGKQYGSAGDALRSQLADINDGLETAQNNITQIYGEQDGEIENVSQAQGDITTLQNDASALATDISNTNSSLAPAFSESVTYAIGDYCIYDGTLYVAVAEHTGAWNAADFETAPIGGELETANAETAEAQEITQTVSGNKMGALIDTASGSIASFVPDATVPTVKGLTVNVEPVQDLHGYDSPWPSGGGKNLLDPNRFVEGKYIAANGTLLNGATNVAYEEFLLLKSGSTYTVSCNEKMYNIGVCIYQTDKSTVISRANNYNVSAFTINSADSDRYVRFWFDQDGSTTMTIALLNAKQPMFEIGNARTSYSPYSNICPISGWDSVEVQRTGVNLFDYTKIETINVSMADGGETLRNGLFVRKSGTFTVGAQQGGSSTYMYVRLFNADGTGTQTYNVISESRVTPATFSRTDGQYFAVYDATATNSLTKSKQEFANWQVQVELGSTATAYEHYQGDTYTIQLGQTVYGGTVDAVNGVLTVTHGLFAPTTNTQIVRQPGRAYYYFNVVVPGIANTYVESGVISNIIKSGPFSGGNSVWTGSADLCCLRERSFSFYTDATKEMTGQESLQWLINNGAQIYYPLATPVTVNLTPLEISVLTGQTNNIWADSGDVAVEYAADLKHYIDSKIAAAVAAMS